MEFLTRGALLERNGYFARFCRNWQEDRYHPRYSEYSPGPIIDYDGKEIMLDQQECDRMNAELMQDFQQMLDQPLADYILPSNLIERKLIPDETDYEAQFLALSQALSDMMVQLNWEQLLLIGLHPPTPYLESWHDYPDHVQARDQMEALGMPKDFTGGIVMKQEELISYLPALLMGVQVQALPLAFAPSGDQATIGAFSDRGMIYSFYAGLEEQRRFEGAAMAAGLSCEPA